MFNELVEYFMKFPGIGPRQAKRFAYFLAAEDEKFVQELSELISKIKKNMVQCQSCFRFYESGLADSYKCGICSSLNRDKNILLVVEKDTDLENIEKMGVYNGNYFVLGGTMPLAIGKNSDAKLRLKELFEKTKILQQSLAREEKSLEIILAMSANIEGDNTSRYIEKILEPLSAKRKIKITRLGRGLSTGAELEYIDSETIKNALEGRK